MLEVRFISGNKFKIDEASHILKDADVAVVPIAMKLEELQTSDTNHLVKDKALKAYQKIGRPLFVEHTGLYLAHLKGLPGGLTQIFWDSLEADRFSELFGNTSDTSVVAKTVIGFVDGKRFHFFEGEIAGNIAASPRGDRSFQWDCVFIPDGYEGTFSEMGSEKNEISMRKQALDKFALFLKDSGKV
ncbi:non-canonical purine NTP pyrophosphatase [Rhodococcus hoagii]|nr:non-canonical purine NTP pyrophosphatase [Prescottella equi]